jgi:uncharacterized phage protein (TIGR02220 family)
MAERRMFAKTIVTSDAFLDMPMSARCLYFTLGIFADDDGFVNSPKSIMRQVGATTDDMNVLVSKKFVIAFDSGVIVIKHWRIHNYIQSDRYHQTKYKDELSCLNLDENKAYTLVDKECIHDVSTLDTEVRLGKVRLVEDSIGKDIYSRAAEEIIGYLNEMTAQHYRPNTKKTLSLITARMKEGFTVDDFKTVIYKKACEWKDDPKMVKFLRPETLFGTKFEGYLNQLQVNKQKGRLGWIDDIR